MTDAYQARGVSATKEEVHEAIANQDRGLFPGAFCTLFPDPSGDAEYCSVLHADGAGTKSIIAYLMYRETGDPSWFSGIAQDSLVMNTDDVLCVGALDHFYVSNTIGRNAHRVNGSCLSALIQGYSSFIERVHQEGISITLTGGETADVGDLVRTVICDVTLFARICRKRVIDASRIEPGLSIVGLSSSGTMKGEDKENSGIGSNGLTAARHLLLDPGYRTKYPESFSDTLDSSKAYTGSWRLDDRLPGTCLTVGEALLSPTRTYLPVVRDILHAVPDKIRGLIHCTGGGQAKCRDFGRNIRIVKDHLFTAPPIFEIIRESGQISDREMFQVFNMGHRMEIYCVPSAVDTIQSVCRQYQLDAQVVGYTEPLKEPGPNEVVIQKDGQTFTYTAKSR